MIDQPRYIARHIAFISHPHHDKKLAQEIGRCLASKGIEPILDEWGFHKGRSLLMEIERAVRRSTCFILLWSSAARSSNYVQLETEIASSKRTRCTAYRMQIVRLDDTPVPSLHSWINFHDWRRGRRGTKLFNRHLEVLWRAVAGLPSADAPAVADNNFRSSGRVR